MARLTASGLVLTVATLAVIAGFDGSSAQDVGTLTNAYQWGRKVYETVIRFTSDSGMSTVEGRPVYWSFSGGFYRWRWQWYGTVTDAQTGITGNARKLSRNGSIEWASKDLADKLRQAGYLK